MAAWIGRPGQRDRSLMRPSEAAKSRGRQAPQHRATRRSCVRLTRTTGFENTTVFAKKISAQAARACSSLRHGPPTSIGIFSLVGLRAAAAAATAGIAVGDADARGPGSPSSATRVRRRSQARGRGGPRGTLASLRVLTRDRALGSLAGMPCHMRALDSPCHARCHRHSRVAPTIEREPAGRMRRRLRDAERRSGPWRPASTRPQVRVQYTEAPVLFARPARAVLLRRHAPCTLPLPPPAAPVAVAPDLCLRRAVE